MPKPSPKPSTSKEQPKAISPVPSTSGPLQPPQPLNPPAPSSPGGPVASGSEIQPDLPSPPEIQTSEEQPNPSLASLTEFVISPDSSSDSVVEQVGPPIVEGPPPIIVRGPLEPVEVSLVLGPSMDEVEEPKLYHLISCEEGEKPFVESFTTVEELTDAIREFTVENYDYFLFPIYGQRLYLSADLPLKLRLPDHTIVTLKEPEEAIWLDDGRVRHPSLTAMDEMADELEDTLDDDEDEEDFRPPALR